MKSLAYFILKQNRHLPDLPRHAWSCLQRLRSRTFSLDKLSFICVWPQQPNRHKKIQRRSLRVSNNRNTALEEQIKMAERNPTTANPPSEPKLCQMGCGFFVSISIVVLASLSGSGDCREVLSEQEVPFSWGVFSRFL